MPARTSTEALSDFRALLVLLVDDLNHAVAEGDHEVKRALHWLKFEQPQVWAARIRTLERRRQDALNELRRKQAALTPTGEPQSTVLERRAAEKAKRLLEEAQARQAATRRWARVIEREALLYRGQTMGAREAPRGVLPNAIAHLERLILDLDNYRRVQTQVAPDAPAPGAAPGGDTTARPAEDPPA